MHDANGLPLKKGDLVLIPCFVTNVDPGEDHCNVTVASVYGRRPDGYRETNCMNTGVLLRFNPGDENNLSPMYDGKIMEKHTPQAKPLQIDGVEMPLHLPTTSE